MHASRPASLLAKCGLLTLVTFLLQMLATGAGTGWYFKRFMYQAYTVTNVNWGAALASLFYMTLVTLPYAAFMLLLTVATRSTFASLAIGLGYTQFIEILLARVFYNASWSKWMTRNLYFSATFLLNAIGKKVVEIPAQLLDPIPALVTAAMYTLIFLSLAVWLYRRQDLGG